jgi:hypothetical protein
VVTAHADEAKCALLAAPGSDRVVRLANHPGWTVASDWYLGCPG